ncbi:MAG: methylated-DNA--[protein]-cysteine S-methyltransferase [Bryobacterales bacterium]|nr:methylated-DNA--[protein]-cysteine S-methyltransferase [Bryobacterales bacterium]
MHIEYETGDHNLGKVFVGGTERGVCFLALGGDVPSMVRELNHDYAGATVKEWRGAKGRWLPVVLQALAHPELGPGVPLDVHGTEFQKRVWAALQAIPPGETRTYSGLAAALGNPKSTRAVARACATNRVSVLIPCHRVVGVSGDLTGYRWGKHRKAALLASEREYAARHAR